MKSFSVLLVPVDWLLMDGCIFCIKRASVMDYITGMGQLILVEHFVHSVFFGVSGIGRVWRFRGGCLRDQNVVIRGGGV